MAPQTTKAWIPTPQITNCLFFCPLRQFVPFKWMESESHARHMTFLAQKPENALSLHFENPILPFSLHFEIPISSPENTPLLKVRGLPADEDGLVGESVGLFYAGDTSGFYPTLCLALLFRAHVLVIWLC